LTDNLGASIRHGVITLHLYYLTRIVFFPALQHRGKFLLYDRYGQFQREFAQQLLII